MTIEDADEALSSPDLADIGDGPSREVLGDTGELWSFQMVRRTKSCGSGRVSGRHGRSAYSPTPSFPELAPRAMAPSMASSVRIPLTRSEPPSLRKG